MDATTQFIADVTVALVAGSLAGTATRALGITPIIGYIVAGIIIGPFTPGYVTHGHNLSGLAELGLIFLLFSLGLGFSIADLFRGGIIALAVNLIAMGCVAAVVYAVAAGFGVPHPATLALAFTISSTAVGATLLQVLGLLRKRVGRTALSLLIIQDLIAVILLVIVSTPASSLSVAGVGLPLVRAIAFVAVALVLGATVFHRLFTAILQHAGTELLVGIFSAIALGAAWLGHAAGLTFEFGAFVAGAVTSETAGSRMVQDVVRPFRELFVMLFFVSMGTLADISSIFVNWRTVVVTAIVSIIARWLLFGAVGRLAGLSTAGASALGIALLPMGEFNIVLGNASYAAGRLNQAEMGVLVGAALISIIASAVSARISIVRYGRASTVS
jgi:CPA2 family monovalent cation:H+ antiporter-2